MRYEGKRLIGGCILFQEFGSMMPVHNFVQKKISIGQQAYLA
jgi:hypothetical protein